MAFGSLLQRLLRINAAAPYSLTLPSADSAGVLVSNGAGTLTLSPAPTLTTPSMTTPVVSALLNLTAGQVKFPATQVPSADANVLDDYEEGTWTPTDGSGAGLALTGVVGTYVKIGQWVWAGFAFSYPATGDGTAAKISGLPFVPAANNTGAAAIGDTNYSAAVATALVTSAATTFTFRNTAGAALTNANLSTRNFSGSVMYRADG